MVGVRVQVAMDVPAVLEAAPELGVAGTVVTAAHQPHVHLLDVVGDLAPRPRFVAAYGCSAKLIPQGRLAAEPLELGGEREYVSEREEQPPLALPHQLPVELEVGD